MSIADLLDDWFESPQIKGRARGQRRHRHLGRAVRAGHRLRDGAPLDRRRRRRPARQLGLPRGRHGRRVRGDRAIGAQLRRRDPHQRKGFPGAASAAGGCTGVVLENGDEITAPLVVTTLHPKTAFLDQIPRTELPDDFVSDIEHWKTRSGVVKINLALAELPNFTADPSSGHGRTPHRLRRDGADDGVHRGGVPGRPRRQACADAVQRRRHPHHAGQDAESRWHPHHVAVHPVGARRLGRRPRTPRNSTPTPTG